jgi:FtsP/CotA-like multicopper oxidase with cupredoxin domain
VAGGEVVRHRLAASEVEWEIAPRRTVRGYGFNGQAPGPVLEAKQGVPLEIEFTNQLPEPTVIHWHGLRIPAAMDGTEAVRLINGTSEPELRIAAGQIERWRIVNASSARYLRLSLGGLPFQIIGTDGGMIEAPVTATEVLLPPADRIELAVGPFENEDAVLGIEDLPYYRMAGKKGVEHFGTIRIAPRKPSTALVPARLREIAPLLTGDPIVTRTVKLGFKLSLRRGLDFVINGERHHHDERVKVGELQVWDVVNTTMMDHPFHLHGFFFQVLAINGKKPEMAIAAGRHQRAAEGDRSDRVVSRRQTRVVDVSLPHSRAPCVGNDGALRRRSMNQTRSTAITHAAVSSDLEDPASVRALRRTRPSVSAEGEEGTSAQDDPRTARSRLSCRTSPGCIE